MNDSNKNRNKITNKDTNEDTNKFSRNHCIQNEKQRGNQQEMITSLSNAKVKMLCFCRKRQRKETSRRYLW